MIRIFVHALRVFVVVGGVVSRADVHIEGKAVSRGVPEVGVRPRGAAASAGGFTELRQRAIECVVRVRRDVTVALGAREQIGGRVVGKRDLR